MCNLSSVAHLNLGLTYSTLGLKRQAIDVLMGVSSIDDDGLKDPKTHRNTQVSAAVNAGRILIELGRSEEAVKVLKKARIENESIGGGNNGNSILHLLGEAYQTLNRTDLAESYYRAAVAEGQIPAYLKYGKMLAKNVSKVQIWSPCRRFRAGRFWPRESKALMDDHANVCEEEEERGCICNANAIRRDFGSIWIKAARAAKCRRLHTHTLPFSKPKFQICRCWILLAM